jgi:hypothetical protein
MNIQISYPEIQSLLQSKVKQEITIAYVDNQTIKAGKTITVLGISKTIGLKLRVENVSGDNIVLAHDNPILVKSAMKIVEVSFPEFLEMIEPYSDNSVVVHLGKVKQLEKVFEMVSLEGICFLQEGAVAEAAIK